ESGPLYRSRRAGEEETVSHRDCQPRPPAGEEDQQAASHADNQSHPRGERGLKPQNLPSPKLGQLTEPEAGPGVHVLPEDRGNAPQHNTPSAADTRSVKVMARTTSAAHFFRPPTTSATAAATAAPIASDIPKPMRSKPCGWGPVSAWVEKHATPAPTS